MNDGHYVTAGARLDAIQPIVDAYTAWAALADGDSAQIRRAALMVAHIDAIRRCEDDETVAAEVTDARATVVGLFENSRRARGWHPSEGRDDAPPHGYPRPESDREALAREEMRHDQAMGRYWPEPGA